MSTTAPPQMDIADVHNEYSQQVAMLSQRCAMLSASNGALHRANAALIARITEMEKERAQDAACAVSPAAD